MGEEGPHGPAARKGWFENAAGALQFRQAEPPRPSERRAGNDCAPPTVPTRGLARTSLCRGGASAHTMLCPEQIVVRSSFTMPP
jgi:hypothetical protein